MAVSKQQNTQLTVNNSPWNRTNLVGFDHRTEAAQGFNNAGHGITATLTKNIFNRSFPDWIEHSKLFSTFYWAPMKVVGAGVKNIQWGTKETETYVDYKVGDIIALKIKGRPKVYECRIGDLKIRIQCSLDLPPHWHVDKFIDAGEYIQFINQYKEQLAQSMAKTTYELFRFFFISSCFGTCLPQADYDRLLLQTLSYRDSLPQIGHFDSPLGGVPVDPEYQFTPLFKFIAQNRDYFKALSDEMNKKISNKYVFDVEDVIHQDSGTRFNPYKAFGSYPEGKGNGDDPWKKLRRCLISNGAEIDANARESEHAHNRASREKSLKAFEIVLASIAKKTEEPSWQWWQGNVGNMGTGNPWNSNYPNTESLYEANKGTTIMDRPINQRPKLIVECRKENRILIISKSDYDDFVSGAYKGYFGPNSTAELNWGRVAELFAEIIPIPDMPCGHALILDKRMIAVIPHLETSGTDTIMQRLVTMETMHKWLIFGLFDQFVGVRIQMTGYTGAPIDMNNIFFQFKDIQMAATV